MLFSDKEIVVTDHARERFAERTYASSTGSVRSKQGIDGRIIRAVRRSEKIDAERLIGLVIRKGTTYAFDKLRDLLFPLEACEKGKKFRVITVLTKTEFEIL